MGAKKVFITLSEEQAKLIQEACFLYYALSKREFSRIPDSVYLKKEVVEDLLKIAEKYSEESDIVSREWRYQKFEIVADIFKSLYSFFNKGKDLEYKSNRPPMKVERKRKLFEV